MRRKIALCLALAMSLSMTACKATPTNSPSVETGESTSVTETAETTATSPEVTTVPVETTVPEETTTPEITTTEATTTTVITTTVPETTTTVPETTTVVTTTTAPVTTTTVPETTTVVTTTTVPVTTKVAVAVPSRGYDDAFTQEWIDATNAERRRLGLPEYKINESLMECAAIRSKEMCDYKLNAGHTRPNGDIWSTVLKGRASGIYQGGKLNGDAENTARTWIDLIPDGNALSNGYANSPGHYKNMTNKIFVYVGASVYHDGNGQTYSCMIFTT